MEHQPLFSSGMSRAMVGAATVLVLLAVLLALYGGALMGPNPTQIDSYSRSAIGHRVLFEFYPKVGFRTQRLTHLQHARVEDPLLFLEPKSQIHHMGKRHRLRDVLQQRHDKGYVSIVVLPKWHIRKQAGNVWAESRPASNVGRWLKRILPDVAKRLYIERTIAPSDVSHKPNQMQSLQTLTLPMKSPNTKGTQSTNKTRQLTFRLLLPQHFAFKQAKKPQTTPKRAKALRDALRRAATHGKEADATQTKKRNRPTATKKTLVPPRHIEVVVGNQKGAFVLRISAPGRGDIWLVSDPDLMHNFNLHRGQHPIFWHMLARRYNATRLIFDECFHDHLTSLSLTQELGRFPNVLLVLQVLLLLALFSWYGMRRFGVYQPFTVRAGRGPQEVIDITAWVLVCGGHMERVAASYVERVLQDAGERLGLKQKQGSRLAQQLDRMARNKGIPAEATRLQEWADGVREQEKQRPRDAMQHAHLAWQFRKELLRQKTTSHTTTITKKPKA